MCDAAHREGKIEATPSSVVAQVPAEAVDGTIRVVVGAESKFACVDGPEFDGHLVDFDGLADRLTIYRGFEEQARHAATDCRLLQEVAHG